MRKPHAGIKRLKRSTSGLPVPWVVRWSGEARFVVREDEIQPGWLALCHARDDRSGDPQFASLHMARQREAAVRRLCAVCGDPICGPRWNVMLSGDPPSRHRDPGTCAACLAFALRVCPGILRHRSAWMGGVEVLEIEEAQVSFDLLCAVDIEQCPDLRVTVSVEERSKLKYRSALGLALVVPVKFNVMTVDDFLKRYNRR